ncbi:B12 lower ligand biosynthesis radical SAM protein BzaD [Candidatus Contubernalis alkaliaceticus]|uniref:B12 lower ligand biosynthesis radical SAM protein BzaD n=1 Tax=Candidatus Contubernalis alkaliaceticus TaxID=338645 RepID=UPI001F4BDDAF|nr:B12 lower ligand biosynthesis radical SAM protein BzaD [Candidatus Contubernalis alkalaceticus]UNC90990.1 B12 lower ligand biosynthesis radical SAM protein BzaD [Candidatus Contubernalis alkalaceticus]
MKKRVLLVQALSMEEPSAEKVYPLGIVILATSLKNEGHEVGLLDMNMEKDSFGALKERLLTFEPEVVGISLRNIDPLANKNSSLIPPFQVMVKMAAALRPKAWLIVGGTGFSLFPQRLMEDMPEIHYGIVGEAEESLPTLLSTLESPSIFLKGLCFREGGRVMVNSPSRNLDFSCYRVPSRELLDPGPYLENNSYVPSMGVETKRGCPFTCGYCVYPALQGENFRCRPPEKVVEEMEMLYKEFGIDRFHFTDPVVNAPRGHLEDICRELLRRRLPLKWSGFMREDYLDEKNVSLFERAGCECFSFSPDGLCQNSLEVLGKNLNQDQVLKAAELAAGSNVLSVYHFMVNVPGETEETCRQGIQLMEKIFELHSRKQNLGTMVLNNIRILPGTSMEAAARANGVIHKQTDLLYPVYYNPRPFETLRYRLEAFHLHQNIFMWNGVSV